MREYARLVLLAGFLAGLVAGCSRPVAPTAPSSGVRAQDGSALRAAGNARPWLVRLEFEGPVVTLDARYEPHVEKHARFFVFSDGTPLPPTSPGPPDTVPAYSRLVRVRWARSLADTVAGTPDAAAEARDAAAAALANGLRDTAATFPAGVQQLWLTVPERLGGGRVPVYFHVGFVPGAWWAGPDPSRFPPSSDGDGRAVDVTNWASFECVPAWPPDGRGYFGPDSFGTVPSRRRPVGDDFERRTFYEIFGDRIYARAEGDTVHQGAWVVFVNGGFDRDSRYAPIAVAGDPGLPPGFPSQPALYPALVGQGLIGAPSAFRSQLITRRPDGSYVQATQSSPYPLFDPGSVFRSPHVAGYERAAFAGKAYLVATAQDAEWRLGRAFGSYVAITDLVDAGGGDARDRQARRQVLTFHVRAAAPAP